MIEEVAMTKIRAGLAWLMRMKPDFTGEYQVSVHFKGGKPMKLEKLIRDSENLKDAAAE